jgi:hypothetical protein
MAGLFFGAEGERRSRFPEGMTERKARTTARTLVGDAGVGGIDAEGGGEGGEVVLLLEEDVAELLAEGELVELVGLLDAAAVVADGLDFVGEVEAEHVFGLLAGLDGLGGDGGHAAEVVDLVGEDEGVGELFGGVDGELGGDVHVGRALEDLGVVDVGDDSLEFALEIFVEEINEFLAGDGRRFVVRFLCHGEVRLAFLGLRRL